MEGDFSGLAGLLKVLPDIVFLFRRVIVWWGITESFPTRFHHLGISKVTLLLCKKGNKKTISNRITLLPSCFLIHKF